MSLVSNLTLMFMVLSLGILIMEKVQLWLKKNIETTEARIAFFFSFGSKNFENFSFSYVRNQTQRTTHNSWAYPNSILK